MPAKALWSVFAVSAVGGMFLQQMLKNSKTAPYIQFLLSLILLLMLLSPLAQVLTGLRLDDPGEILASYRDTDGGTFYDDAVTDGVIVRVSSSLAALISAETGIPAEDMDIGLTTETVQGDTGSEIAVTAVTVTLYSRAHKIAAEKICAVVKRVMLCPCSVVTEVREHA